MFEDGTIINELFIERLNYFIYVILLLIGLHGMIAKNNLIKKLIGMSIFQTAIILFYVSVGVKEGATIPIYLPEHDPHGSHASHGDENGTEDAVHGPVVLEAGIGQGVCKSITACSHAYCNCGGSSHIGFGLGIVSANLSGVWYDRRG
jgi:multisubunit Na+/H+ antiporter MnhC subunit